MHRALCLAGLFFLLAITLFGQTLGTITGEVKDTTGAMVVGATVTVTNTATNVSRNTQTNEVGIYNFPALVPGPYSVKVEATGFRTVVRGDIDLQIQQTARIDFVAEVGQVTETVIVSGSAALLATEDATVGTVIENRRIVELPLNGRDFLQLVALSPNVTNGFGAPGQASGRQGGTRATENISIMGMRGTWNHYTLDGIENTDVNFNLYVLLPSIDALQEFKVQSGIYPAEFGREASQINVSTKPGTSQFHGSLFEFLRNDRLDAKQYDFVGSSPAKQPFKWNQYGFTLGGPVWIPKLLKGKDRLFFMTNFEGFNRRQTSYALYTTPTPAMRNGDFSFESGTTQLLDPATRTSSSGSGTPFPNNQIPTSRFDPVSLKLMQFWPAPNVVTSRLANNYQATQLHPIDKNQFTQRVDLNESTKSQWFGRYSWTDESTADQQLYLNGTTLYTRASQWMLSNTRMVSPNKVNEFRFGVNSFANVTGLELSNRQNVVDSLGIPGMKAGDAKGWGIPRMTAFVGVSGFGNDSSNPFIVNDAVFQWIDNFSWTRGRHSIRLGGEVRRDRYNQAGNEFSRGSFEFNGQYSRDSSADFLLGSLSKAEYALNLAFGQYRTTNMAYYVDDVWKVTPKLTVNLGLRWELMPPFYDKSQHEVSVNVSHILLGNANVADPSLHPVFVRAGSGDFYEGIGFRYPGVAVARDGRLGDRLVQTNYHDFAPRFGIAYSPTPKWTIRTGFGIFYSAESNNSKFDLNRGLGGRVTQNGDPNIANIGYMNFLTSAASPWVLPAGPFLWSLAYDLKDTTSMQYLLNVQRQLGKETTVEASYNALLNRHLWGLQNANAPLPSATGSYASRAPFPEFNYIQMVQSGGTGSYNAVSAKVTRRMSSGLTFLGSYTWSKSLDTTSAIRGTNVDIFPQNSACMACDKGFSAFNVPARFVASVLYELPFGKGKPFVHQGGVANVLLGGWQISSIWTTQSGLPLNPGSGIDSVNQSGYGEIRANSNGQDPYLSSGQRSTNQWFNISNWGPPLPGQFGNMSRNRLMGPTNTFFDGAILKNFQIREGHQLQFRMEAFNAANHPAWAGPNVTWNSRTSTPAATFGKITGTTNAMRQMQMALKYTF
jgi:hypothetical protein